MGGLGIRRASLLALPAFLASAASTLRLQTLILTYILVAPDAHVESMTSEWRSKTESNDVDSLPTHQQALWDKPLLKQSVKTLVLSTVDPYNTARLKAVSSPHTGYWLNPLPITACGLRLDDEDVRIAVGLRLGAAIYEPHIRSCGARIDATGSHGLSCSLGFGRIARHSTINDIIHRTPQRQGSHPSKNRQVYCGRQKTRWLDHDPMVCESSSGVGCYGGGHPCIILCPGHGSDGRRGGRYCHGEKKTSSTALS